ncbi:MAG: hypothetical protein KDC53_14945 [Saprospiraceae bacterium]|nr:hypothetical protein [Saprospiraceae bacterium]
MIRKVTFFIFLPITCTLHFSFVIGQVDAAWLLKESIKYHDPANTWARSKTKLTLREIRPESEDRITTLTIDDRRGNFLMQQIRDGYKIEFKISGDDHQILLNGRVPEDTAVISRYRLNQQRVFTMRDYYSYLYSLPMRLVSDGSIIAKEAKETIFDDQKVYAIKVTYPPQVGNDTWYFYFDKVTKQLTGYRFYHHEEDNDGEYIILEDAIKVGNLLIPQKRSWYTNKGGEFLGTDIVIEGS